MIYWSIKRHLLPFFLCIYLPTACVFCGKFFFAAAVLCFSIFLWVNFRQNMRDVDDFTICEFSFLPPLWRLREWIIKWSTEWFEGEKKLLTKWWIRLVGSNFLLFPSMFFRTTKFPYLFLLLFCFFFQHSKRCFLLLFFRESSRFIFAIDSRKRRRKKFQLDVIA